MKKNQFVKCNNITIGAQLLCKIINPNYNETSIEVEIIEGNFKGSYVIVNLVDVIVENEEIKQEGNTQELINILDLNNIDFVLSHCDNNSHICIEGNRHEIYIDVDESGYYGSTKHLEKEIGLYEDTYKNSRAMLKVNTVIKYIEKYL